MNELVLELEEIAPKEFFGPQNINIELLKRYFPKLKIVARGNKITAFGDEELLEEFDKRMEMLFSHFSSFNKLESFCRQEVCFTSKCQIILIMRHFRTPFIWHIIIISLIITKIKHII